VKPNSAQVTLAFIAFACGGVGAGIAWGWHHTILAAVVGAVLGTTAFALSAFLGFIVLFSSFWRKD